MAGTDALIGVPTDASNGASSRAKIGAELGADIVDAVPRREGFFMDSSYTAPAEPQLSVFHISGSQQRTT